MPEEVAHVAATITRHTGRVLLANRANCVLLFSAVALGAEGTRREIWLPPGGGTNVGERVVAAAARELCEETGLCVAPKELCGPVAVSRGAWSDQGINYWIEETFFFLRVPEWTVSTAGFTPLEREQVTGHRWWSVADLEQSTASIFPRGLAPLIARLLAGDYPRQPVRLDW